GDLGRAVPGATVEPGPDQDDRPRSRLVGIHRPRAGAGPGALIRQRAAALRRHAIETEPSSATCQPGLWATSHGWPSGSMKTPEQPPQNVAAPRRAIVAPARSASSITASTSAGDRTLCASVTPPQPPTSATPLSSAKASRFHRAITMPPDWKKATPS